MTMTAAQVPGPIPGLGGKLEQEAQASGGIGRSVASAKAGRRTVPRQAGEKPAKEKIMFIEG